MSDESCVYVGNLDLRVSIADLEELLYELFLQAGPVEKVTLPSNGNSGWHKCFGFVEFEHRESVAFSIQLLNGITLYGRPLRVRTAGKSDASSIAKARGAGGPSLVAEQHEEGLPDCTSSLDEPLHHTLGQRLSPPPPLMTPDEHELSSDEVPHPSLGQRLSPPLPPNGLVSSDEVPHPTLGQRLSPSPPPLMTPNGLLSSEPPHPTLGQRLSPPPPPLMTPNGLLSSEPPHPTLGQRLSPRSQMSMTSATGGQRSFLASGLHSPDEALHPTLGQRLSPPPVPLFGCSLSWEQVPNYNTNNDFYHHSSSSWEPPPPPNPIANHVFHMPQPTTHVPLHSHLSSHAEEPPPPSQGDPLSFSAHHHLMHQDRERGDDKPMWDGGVHTDDRGVHTDDKPDKSMWDRGDDKPAAWITKENKEKVRDYHLLQLGETLARYKDLFSNKSQ